MTTIKKLNISKDTLHKILLAFTLIYFFIFGTLMAHTSGQPDQAPHGYYSRRFTETWGIPEEDLTIRYTVTGQPYLYYWLNGAVYKMINLFVPADHIKSSLLWRMMSVVIATFTVFYTYKLAKKVTGNPFGGVLAAFFLSNTLMFVFMSGGISYDNLMYLASTAAIYHLVCVYQKEDFLRQTALTGIWVIIGALTKEQFLLLTLIIFLAWLYYVIRHSQQIKLYWNRRNLLTGLVFLAFLGLFLGLYGVNLIKYGRPTPSCGTIKPREVCSGYSYRYEFYQPFNLQYLWFVRDHYTNPVQYAVQYWTYKMAQSTWGILSHNTFVPQWMIGLHFSLAALGAIAIINDKQYKGKVIGLLIMIFLLYILYVFLWNYETEVKFSFQHYGVTGRYLLPIISTFLTLLSFSLFYMRDTNLRRLAIIFAIILYFAGGLGMFISRYATVFAHWRIFY
jgi:4-amino-4-deoxy-L-arabinose transferase-like glycosyltransferase